MEYPNVQFLLFLISLRESFKIFNESIFTADLENFVDLNSSNRSCEPVSKELKTTFAEIKHQIFLRLLDVLIISGSFFQNFIDEGILQESFWNVFVQ